MVLLLGLSGSFWTCWNTVRFTVYKLCKSPISFAWEIRIYMNTICRRLDLCQPHNNNSVTHRSFVVLWLCAEEAVDLLHSCHLNLQVCQVPHNPVQVVGDLHRDIQRDWIMFLNIKIKFFFLSTIIHQGSCSQTELEVLTDFPFFHCLSIVLFTQSAPSCRHSTWWSKYSKIYQHFTKKSNYPPLLILPLIHWLLNLMDFFFLT